MMVPAGRGGRGAARTTATAGVTSSSPRSPRSHVAIGFFFAAIMVRKLGMRGSFAWSVTDSRAGSGALYTSVASPIVRVIRTVDPSHSTSAARVTAGSPSTVARAVGTIDVSPSIAVSYTHLRAHETRHDLVCRLLL